MEDNIKGKVDEENRRMKELNVLMNSVKETGDVRDKLETIDSSEEIIADTQGNNTENELCSICLEHLHNGMSTSDNYETKDEEGSETKDEEGNALTSLPSCIHKFHLKCIETWSKKSSFCPCCKTEFNKMKYKIGDLEKEKIAVKEETEEEQGRMIVLWGMHFGPPSHDGGSPTVSLRRTVIIIPPNQGNRQQQHVENIETAQTRPEGDTNSTTSVQVPVPQTNSFALAENESTSPTRIQATTEDQLSENSESSSSLERTEGVSTSSEESNPSLPSFSANTDNRGSLSNNKRKWRRMRSKINKTPHSDRSVRRCDLRKKHTDKRASSAFDYCENSESIMKQSSADGEDRHSMFNETRSHLLNSGRQKQGITSLTSTTELDKRTHGFNSTNTDESSERHLMSSGRNSTDRRSDAKLSESNKKRKGLPRNTEIPDRVDEEHWHQFVSNKKGRNCFDISRNNMLDDEEDSE